MWFWRTVQIVGLGLVLYEFLIRKAVTGDDKDLTAVLVGLVMMTGALGIERLTQYWLRR